MFHVATIGALTTYIHLTLSLHYKQPLFLSNASVGTPHSYIVGWTLYSTHNEDAGIHLERDKPSANEAPIWNLATGLKGDIIRHVGIERNRIALQQFAVSVLIALVGFTKNDILKVTCDRCRKVLAVYGEAVVTNCSRKYATLLAKGVND